MRHADVHEMRGAGAARGVDRRENRRQIDALELGGFRRRRMRRAHEVHDRVRGSHPGRERRRVQRVADHGRGAGRGASRRFGSYKRTNTVAARDERLDQASPDVACRAGNKDVS